MWIPQDEKKFTEAYLAGCTNDELARLFTTSLNRVDHYLRRKHKAGELPLRGEFNPTGEIPEEVAPDPIEKRKNQLLSNARKVIEKKAEKERAALELTAEAIKYAVSLTTPLVVPAPVCHAGSDRDTEVAVIHISDSQVGEVVDAVHSYGLSEYNSNIFCHRADMLARKVVEWTDSHRKSTNVEKLIVLLGGDLVHNDTMRPAAKNHADMEVVSQTMLAARVLQEKVLLWLQHFDEVEVHCVPGNHGRIGKKGENHPMSNYDYICYLMLQEMLYGAFPDRNRLKIRVPWSMFTVVPICGWKFLLSHGDSIRAWLGIPFYGAIRAKTNYDNMLDLKDEDFDYLVVGHHHQYANWEHAKGEIFMNGSWVGPSTFSINDMNKGSRASQNFFFVSKEWGVGSRRRIYLDRIVNPLPNIVDRYIQHEFTDLVYSKAA